MNTNMELIDEIIQLEWQFFQGVNNEGGRASCQDDPVTFHIMRSSQFMTWPEEICQSYRRDLIRAQMQERNPVTEKYARMMESTVPDQYALIQPLLPAIGPNAKEMTEEIVSIHVQWMKEYARQYPELTSRGRYLFSSQDTPWETSAETYLRGELLTYSEETLRLLLEFNRQCRLEGRNLMMEQDMIMVQSYGYTDLEDAETRNRRK